MKLMMMIHRQKKSITKNTTTQKNRKEKEN